jgi:peptidoglycan hydrolase CwlO-like protein
VAQVDAERQAIVQEQARLRENLARVPANSDLQRRYLATLDKQETELEALANRRAETEKAAEAARDALRSYVSQLG